MPSKNVDVVRAIYRAFERFDRGDPETTAANPDAVRFVVETFDPQVEIQQMSEIPGTGGTFRGYEGLLDSWRELTDALQELRFEIEEEFDLGDRIVITVRAHATGRESGTPVTQRLGHLWELREGRVTRWVVYPSPAEALRAVGLAK